MHLWLTITNPGFQRRGIEPHSQFEAQYRYIWSLWALLQSSCANLGHSAWDVVALLQDVAMKWRCFKAGGRTHTKIIFFPGCLKIFFGWRANSGATYLTESTWDKIIDVPHHFILFSYIFWGDVRALALETTNGTQRRFLFSATEIPPTNANHGPQRFMRWFPGDLQSSCAIFVPLSVIFIFRLDMLNPWRNGVLRHAQRRPPATMINTVLYILGGLVSLLTCIERGPGRWVGCGRCMGPQSTGKVRG